MKKITILLIIIIFTTLSLTACQSKWKVAVNLTDAERATIESDIKTTKALITEQIKKDGKGQYMAYVNLARAYEKLGEVKKATQVYRDAIDSGLFAGPLNSNLGGLYEQVGEYDKAVEQYQIMINKFQEKRYLYDIAWAYIHDKDFKKAEQYYEIWKKEFLKSDEAIEKELKKLQQS